MIAMSVDRLKLEVVCEAIDRLVTLDLHARGVMTPLYEAARAKAGTSFCLSAAERLADAVQAPGDVVIIGTGFMIGTVGKPETDGLVGAAVLARGLSLGLGARPVIVTESEAVPVVAAACEAAELNVYFDLDSAASRPKSVVILPFTKSEREAPAAARTMFAQTKPVAMVAIERPGRNEAGVYHGALGKDISDMVAKVDHLFLEVQRAGRLTVAVGDLGNELGMGAIQDAVRQVTPFGARCICPCGKGNACAIEADVTVVGAISDDAVYGILACLAHILGKPDVLHSSRIEERVIRAAVAHGGIDGPSECPKEAIDLVDSEIHQCLIEVMRSIFRYADQHTAVRREFLEYLKTCSANDSNSDHQLELVKQA